ncbi:DUF6390 family protein [Actinoplanes sp. NPDC000266]
MSEAGALLFARYAYPPNELGYCGPAGASALLAPGVPGEIAARARQFEGAWSYLELLAATAGIGDPLDETVVRAYWVGGALLDEVPPAALVAWLGDRFRGQRGGTWRSAGERAVAHHSFHVFEVYPWAAMLGAGPSPVALRVLDRCRVRTGVVLRVDGERAIVRSGPLVSDGTSLSRGPDRPEEVRWSAGGRSLIGAPAPGDRVALHWDWVCDVLTAEQAGRLDALQERQLGQFRLNAARLHT